jgi:hypothetical protein
MVAFMALLYRLHLRVAKNFLSDAGLVFAYENDSQYRGGEGLRVVLIY